MQGLFRLTQKVLAKRKRHCEAVPCEPAGEALSARITVRTVAEQLARKTSRCSELATDRLIHQLLETLKSNVTDVATVRP